MSKLDIDWLHVFVEVYRTHSVSRAAERLGIAQSNASVALNRLREHFDDRLFARTSRGMVPTPYAQAIFSEVQDTLARITRLRESRPGFDPARSERVFRICMTDISEIVLLPTLVNHLQRVAPAVAIEAERISTDSPLRLESGDIDLAVGFMPHLEAGFYQQTLFMQDFVCLAASDHPRIRSKPSRRAFLAERHISVTTSGTGHAIVDRVLQDKGLERRIALRVPSFLGVGRLVAATELLVVAPRRLAEALADREPVRLLDPPVSLPAYAVKQHWHERYHADAGNVWLRRTMAQLIKA